MTTTILTLVGSLRGDSNNRQIAEAAAAVAPADVNLVTYEDLTSLPFYNEDIDVPGSVPAAAEKFRAAVAEADAVLLVSPEYNGTMPAVLKNAIDWASRPYGASSISAKPAAVIGSSVSPYGATRAHDDGRRSLGVAGASVLEDAQLSIGASMERFAEIHPKDDAELVEQVTAILRALSGAANTPAAA
ncbi:NAD(P)H-dependent oxidoreductase [Arthrobacter sp. TMN-37]